MLAVRRFKESEWESPLSDWFKEIINWVRTQSGCLVKVFFSPSIEFLFLPDLCCNDVMWDFVNASVLSEPPFHLTRRGWGEFPVRIQIHFKDPRNKRIDIIHQLKVWPHHHFACFYPADWDFFRVFEPTLLRSEIRMCLWHPFCVCGDFLCTATS